MTDFEGAACLGADRQKLVGISDLGSLDETRIPGNDQSAQTEVSWHIPNWELRKD